MPKVFTSQKQQIGKLGEELAKKYLIKHSYTILAENYTKKYGEIDIIAQKNNKLHFIEVKSIIIKPNNGEYVPRVTGSNVSRVTNIDYDPLQNVHPIKLKRLSRVIQVYLLNKNVSYETQWQFDVITVKINQKDKIGSVKHIKDIII
jgi:putative endonuclease